MPLPMMRKSAAIRALTLACYPTSDIVTSPVRITVRSERASYQVLVGPGLLGRLVSLIKDVAVTPETTLVVTCPPVWRLHGRRVRSLVGGGRRPAIIPDGERAKTLRTVEYLYDELAGRGLDRSGTVVAFGGGVVGDVAGFAAATYLRGIRVVQVPTTLLAQVDSAVGGKTGVNLAAGKNLVGGFHAPALVICDTELLATLPRREFRSGLYEVIKYGVIASRPLLREVERDLPTILQCRPGALAGLVATCCRLKARVVSLDERESGLRRVLNFGHTVGHALEALTRYRRFRHGEAVALGMLAAAHVSMARGMLTSADGARLEALIRRLGGLPRVDDLGVSAALRLIARDKKVAGGRLHFVLARGLGATAIVPDVSRQELTAAMRSIGMK
jgi:3-dehydroquinate synthase